MLVMVVFFIALMCIHLSMPLLRFVLLVLILLLLPTLNFLPFFFSSRRRHTRYIGDWSSDVCSSDLARLEAGSPANLPGPTFNSFGTSMMRSWSVWGPSVPTIPCLPTAAVFLVAARCCA